MVWAVKDVGVKGRGVGEPPGVVLADKWRVGVSLERCSKDVVMLSPFCVSVLVLLVLLVT